MKLPMKYRGVVIARNSKGFAFHSPATYTTDIKEGDVVVAGSVREAKELIDAIKLEKTLRLMARG